MVILIADDDRLIRFMMKSMLTEILVSDDTILEAANGKVMVEICKDKMPDIVFADIKMPYMNGLEAIRECKKFSEDTEFVVISGYSEFEYAQEAIKLGVNDYLLKPVEEEHLRGLMEKLQQKIIGNKRKSNAQFQLKLFNMFNYFATVGFEEEYEEEQPEDGFTYDVIGMHSRSLKRYQDFNKTFQKNIIDRMSDFGKKFVRNGNCYSQIYSPEGIPYFVFYTTGERKKEILSYVKKLGMQNKNEKIAFNFISFSAESMKEIYSECEKNDESLGRELNYPPGVIVEKQEDEISDIGREILKNTDALLNAWEDADGVAYKEILNNMYRKYKDESIDVDFECLSQNCSLIMQKKINGDSYKEFCKSFVDISESMYGNVENIETNVIDKVKAYVEKNYMNDVSIGQIAELFDITPNYLSAIFHQKAGCKFVDYLIDVRIANAKRLLIQNKTASVKDIAVMVGYNSSRYFATLFQKVTGIKPSTYRKENIKN